MSETSSLTAGVVAEGPTDHAVIEKVLATLTPADTDLRVLAIQPESSDAFGGFGQHGGGWKGVRSWCEQTRQVPGGLPGYLSAAYGPPLDVLLVQVDADVAGDAEIGVEKACPPARATTDALRKVMLQWLGPDAPPRKLVLVVPSKSTEAWVLAALASERNEAIPGIECLPEPARWLTRRPYKVLGTKDGEPKEDQDVYADILGPRTAARWDRVCEACPEARRLADEFAAAMAAAAGSVNAQDQSEHHS
jgi:hypothetical protein